MVQVHTRIFSVWEHLLGEEKVVLYGIGSEVIDFIRTPKGKGYGQWERNPNFDLQRDRDKITMLRSGGFSFLIISELKINIIE